MLAARLSFRFLSSLALQTQGAVSLEVEIPGSPLRFLKVLKDSVNHFRSIRAKALWDQAEC